MSQLVGTMMASHYGLYDGFLFWVELYGRRLCDVKSMNLDFVDEMLLTIDAMR